MVTKTIDVHEAQSDFKELLALIQEGTEIILTEDDKPLARITPLGRKKRLVGLHVGSIWTSDDFDAPLPDEFWLGDE